MTGAPLVVNGVVIAGVAGAEFSHRGFLEGYDAETGKHLWRHYNIPAKGEPGSETWEGDSYLTGGGSSWVTGSYDPELDLVYWGTGNPSPWNPRARAGDNLWTNAVIAIRPKTGERVWVYQTTPADPFDYDGVHTPVVATIPVQGQPRKVVIQANRGGFLYVLDAKDGKLLAANAFGKVNWADGVDMTTGRPKHNQVYRDALEGKKVDGVAVGVGRHQLAAHVVQPADRLALHQHAAHRHDLRGAGAAEAHPRQAVRDAERPAHGGVGRSQRPRLSQGRRSDDRQVEVGSALQEPELRVHAGHGEQPRVHRHDDRRIPGASMPTPARCCGASRRRPASSASR